MDLTDYYNILELPPSATTEEIKKAYRRLALTYHPDKKENDPYAAAQFAMIKEAYEVLTDPARKNQYLQDRWYAKSTGKVKARPVLNPVNFLKETLELERSVARMDSHRIDHEGFLTKLVDMFSSEVIEMLNRFDDRSTNSEIVRLAINTARWLKHSQQKIFYSRLEKITVENDLSIQLKKSLRDSQQQERWDRIKVWLLLLIVTAICMFIYLVGR